MFRSSSKCILIPTRFIDLQTTIYVFWGLGHNRYFVLIIYDNDAFTKKFPK